MLTHVRFGYQTAFQHAEAGIFVTPMFNFMSFFRMALFLADDLTSVYC
jgi:hypothetical protein